MIFRKKSKSERHLPATIEDPIERKSLPVEKPPGTFSSIIGTHRTEAQTRLFEALTSRNEAYEAYGRSLARISNQEIVDAIVDEEQFAIFAARDRQILERKKLEKQRADLEVQLANKELEAETQRLDLELKKLRAQEALDKQKAKMNGENDRLSTPIIDGTPQKKLKKSLSKAQKKLSKIIADHETAGKSGALSEQEERDWCRKENIAQEECESIQAELEKIRYTNTNSAAG